MMLYWVNLTHLPSLKLWLPLATPVHLTGMQYNEFVTLSLTFDLLSCMYSVCSKSWIQHYCWRWMTCHCLSVMMHIVLGLWCLVTTTFWPLNGITVDDLITECRLMWYCQWLAVCMRELWCDWLALWSVTRRLWYHQLRTWTLTFWQQWTPFSASKIVKNSSTSCLVLCTLSLTELLVSSAFSFYLFCLHHYMSSADLKLVCL